MQGLIQKSGYIRSGGGAGNYAEYIATRDGVELLNRSSQYMEYISERPRSHGLFTNTECADLEKTMEEVNDHTAPSGRSSTRSGGRTPPGWGMTRRRVGESSSWLTRRNWRKQ